MEIKILPQYCRAAKLKMFSNRIQDLYVQQSKKAKQTNQKKEKERDTGTPSSLAQEREIGTPSSLVQGEEDNKVSVNP